MAAKSGVSLDGFKAKLELVSSIYRWHFSLMDIPFGDGATDIELDTSGLESGATDVSIVS